MEKYYQYLLNTIKQRPTLKKTLLFICHYFPYIPFVIYPMILIISFLNDTSLFLVVLCKPLIAFLIVTVLRKLINRKRPYETMNITPLIQHKKGESFPSRHAVSATIIALVSINVNIYLGLFMCMIAVVICLSRIVAGVHYISDVLVAIMIAFLIYII